MSKSKTGKTRVAAYIRVGGSGETGCEMQNRFYKDMVSRNPEWEFAGIYADLGYEMRDRPELKRLIADCEAGRVDLIVTKNTTRMSRSLMEVMEIIRKLRYLKHPVGIYFEDSGLNTLESDNLIMLSVVEAMAINESRRKHETLLSGTPMKHFNVLKKPRTRLEAKPDETQEDA